MSTNDDDRQTNDDVNAHRTRTNIRPNHDALLNADVTEATTMADATMRVVRSTRPSVTRPQATEPLFDRPRP